MATPRKSTSRSTTASAPLTLVLKVTLLNVEPSCWRRLVVDARMSLDRLHQVIQRAFGWDGGHLHEFWSSLRSPADHPRYAPPDPSGGRDPYDPVENSARTRLSPLLARRGAKLYYIYDFGDCWEHEIRCEKTYAQAIADLPKPIEFDGTDGGSSAKPRRVWAFCVDGAGRTPPEDCGGPPGYARLLHVTADPSEKDHDEMREWLGLDEGETWDPNLFDLDGINDSLAALR